MARKRFASLLEEILKIRRSEESGLRAFATKPENEDLALLPIGERVQKILSMNQKAKKIKPGEIYFFVFYDIEHNKVRGRIAKYLLRMGCERMQKSVYLALLNRTVYEDMKQTLAEIQAMYDNNDSIVFLPVGTEQVENMKLIGKNLEFSLTFEQTGTLFF
jgi:CRISPR-associated endonuclease Cas2